MPAVDNRFLTSAPNTVLTHDEVYGVPEADYSGETLMQTLERHDEAIEANFQENLISSKLAVTAYQKGEELLEDFDMFMRGEKKDPNFNPYKYIPAGYEDYALEFKDCDTLGDVNRVFKRINAENKNYEAMSKVPAGMNFAYGLISGFADPVNFIPVGGTILKADTALKGGIGGAISAFGANAVQEAIIKEMSYNYTNDEYQQNVLFGTIFGATLGSVAGGVRHLSTMKDRYDYEKMLEQGSREQFDTNVKENTDLARKDLFDDKFQEEKGSVMQKLNDAPIDERLGIDEDSTIGAAMVKETATEVDTGNVAAKAIIAAERKINPVMHLATAVSKKSRELANKLFEMPFFTKNVQDSFNVESMNKKTNTELSFLGNDIADNYKRYYFDNEDVGLKEDIKLANPAFKTQQGKMTQAEFYEGVFDYIRHGLHKDNKYIVDSAKKFKAFANIQRDRINELHERGLIDIAAPDENWVPFMIDKSKVVADTNGFVTAVAEKLKTFTDEVRRTGEYENKVKALQSTEKNIESYTQDNEPVVKDINRMVEENERMKPQLIRLDARISELDTMLKKEKRALEKGREKLFKSDKDIDIPRDKDLAHKIKFGLDKRLAPKTLTESIKEAGYLIDDSENLLGKDTELSVQNYRGRKKDSFTVVNLDDLGESLWQDGWYRERPTVDELVNDLLSDEGGVGPKYHENSTDYLLQEYEIDKSRQVIANMGYDYRTLTTEQIDNILTEAGDKGYIRRAYVNRERVSQLGKRVASQQAKVNKMAERREFLKEKAETTRKAIEDNQEKLASQRQLRDMNKEEIRKLKSQQRRLERNVEMLSDLLRMSDEDYEFFARDMAEEIKGVKDMSKASKSIPINERGSMKSRDFFTGNIDNLEPFLVKDITKLLSPLRRETIDLNLIDKFGSVGLDDQIDDVVIEYGKIRKGLEEQRSKNPDNADAINKKIARLDKEEKDDIDFLRLSVGRMRGTEYANHKYGDNVMKAVDLMKLYNVATSLGRVTISSIADLSGAVLKTDLKSALPALKMFKQTFNPDLVKKLREVPELAHATSELFTNIREMSFAEMVGGNPFESNTMKKSRAYVDIYMHLTGLSRWNALGKSIAGLAGMNKFYSIAEKLAKGGKLGEFESKWAKLYGFTENELKEVYENMNKYGNVSGSQKYANSSSWENKELATKFVLGINKLMDTAVVTPGAEKIKLFDDPLMSLILQFKQFMFSSTSRTLIPSLQNARDFGVAQGLGMAMILGMFSIAAKDALSGKEDRTPGEYITEGFKQSGVAGWTELPFSIINTASRGGIDRLMYASTGGFLGNQGMTSMEASREAFQLLGPSLGKVKNILSLTGDISSGQFSKADAYKLKGLIPLQNTIYLDWVLKKLLTSWSD